MRNNHSFPRTLCLFALLAFLCHVFPAEAQNLRCTYSHQKKDDPEKGYKTYKDMLLDVCDGRSLFYNERDFVYDSLFSISFDKNGSMLKNEAAEQLRELEVNRPTHIFIQAGVGSFASSVVGYFTNLFPDHPPKFVIVEPKTAACLYKGAKLGTGEPQIVKGDLKTIMAGLA